MAVGLLGRDEGRAQPARSAGIGDACTPVRRAFTAALSLVALSRRRRGSEGSKGEGQNSESCCFVELFYTTRFDASVVTHRGLIRCSSGESEGTSVGVGQRQRLAKRAANKGRPARAQAKDFTARENKTENRIHKTNNRKG